MLYNMHINVVISRLIPLQNGYLAPGTEASVSKRARLVGVVCSTKVDKVYT